MLNHPIISLTRSQCYYPYIVFIVAGADSILFDIHVGASSGVLPSSKLRPQQQTMTWHSGHSQYVLILWRHRLPPNLNSECNKDRRVRQGREPWAIKSRFTSISHIFTTVFFIPSHGQVKSRSSFILFSYIVLRLLNRSLDIIFSHIWGRDTSPCLSSA